MRIAGRLNILVAAPLVALLVVGAITWHQLERIVDRMDFMGDNVTLSLAKLNHVGHNLFNLDDYASSLMRQDRPAGSIRDHASFDSLCANTFQLLRFYEDHLIADAKDRALLSQTQNSFVEWTNRISRCVAQRTTGDDRGAGERSQGDGYVRHEHAASPRRARQPQ
jgi:hypothetical protein